MNWPKDLLDIFDICRSQNVPCPSRYYGPYNKLLDYALMDHPFTFIIFPQKVAPDDLSPYEATDSVFRLVVFNLEYKPVLFAEIKDDSWADEPYTRLLADAQIRQQYNQLLFHCPIPRLYGLSLLGTSLRVYCGDKVTGKITPDFVNHPSVDCVLPCNYLGGEWDLDILSLDGLKKMQEIIAYIKAEAANDTG
jgi:hypothetical protein